MRLTLYFVMICWCSTAAGHVQDTIFPVKRGAVLQLVSRQFSFTEGPAMNRKGEVFFTDQPNNTIWKFGTNGALSLFKENAGRSNGLFFDRDGRLIACADEKNELWAIEPDGRVRVLLKDFEGKLFNGPNDVWADPSGGYWFTDPYYKRDYWTRGGPEQPGQALYYLPRGGRRAFRVDSSFVKPNGLIGSADGKLLYVTDLGDNKTYVYEITAPGKLGRRTLFARQGCDGMTLDHLGNVYLTGKGITIFDRSGKRLRHVAVPEDWTANVCFGGAEKNLLFITAKQAVYTLQMQVRADGAPVR